MTGSMTTNRTSKNRSALLRMACGAAAGVSLPQAALAQESGQAADKSRYHLFNPTPVELRRPLSADRPDGTESPYTVDAGAAQLELSFVEWTIDDSPSGDSDSRSVAPLNFKLGLTNNADIQFIWSPYIDRESDTVPDASGLGALQIRSKINLWGNDGGATAFGVLPFITLPTGDSGVSADQVEGGFLLPFAADLSTLGWEGGSLGAQVGLEWVDAGANGSGGRGTDAIVNHTVVLGQSLTERLGAYLEYIGNWTLDGSGDYAPVLSTGMTYAVSADVVLDAGVFIGLDENTTDDVTAFSGLTVRF